MGRHSAGIPERGPAPEAIRSDQGDDPGALQPPDGPDPIPPRSARRPDGDDEPSLLPEPDPVSFVEPLGLSIRMFLAVLGIGLVATTALSLAALLPR